MARETKSSSSQGGSERPSGEASGPRVAAHTPGPWSVVNGELHGPQGQRVVEARSGISFCLASPTDEDIANGRLRNTAPELLAALQGMVRLSEMGFLASLGEPEENGNFAAFERAKRAIAKALARAEEA